MNLPGEDCHVILPGIMPILKAMVPSCLVSGVIFRWAISMTRTSIKSGIMQRIVPFDVPPSLKKGLTQWPNGVIAAIAVKLKPIPVSIAFSDGFLPYKRNLGRFIAYYKWHERFRFEF
jgi:hypothetical protein